MIVKDCTRCGADNAKHYQGSKECVECEAKRKRGYYKANRLSILAKRSAHYDKNRETILETRAGYWRKNRKKVNAAATLRYRVKKGSVAQPDSCESCGKPCKPEAHYEDYSKPLDVKWLCRSCHGQHHSVVQRLAV